MCVHPPSKENKVNHKLEMMKHATPAIPAIEIESDDDAMGGLKCKLTCDISCTQTCGVTKIG
jgi:hypothetical protein